jgi:hypothetical protein
MTNRRRPETTSDAPSQSHGPESIPVRASASPSTAVPSDDEDEDEDDAVVSLASTEADDELLDDEVEPSDDDELDELPVDDELSEEDELSEDDDDSDDDDELSEDDELDSDDDDELSEDDELDSDDDDELSDDDDDELLDEEVELLEPLSPPQTWLRTNWAGDGSGVGETVAPASMRTSSPEVKTTALLRVGLPPSRGWTNGTSISVPAFWNFRSRCTKVSAPLAVPGGNTKYQPTELDVGPSPQSVPGL